MADGGSPGVPVFSERLTAVLDAVLKGEAPNAGRFCGHCYTPIGAERERCPHCDHPTEAVAPVDRVPDQVVDMLRRLRRRESLVVNSFAYFGLLLGVAIFMAIFYALFASGANAWWYVADVVLLFVVSRLLAGIVGGVIGDNIGYTYARRKLAEDWQAYESKRGR